MAVDPRVKLQTERLGLKPLRLANAPRLAQLANDLDVSRWLRRVPFPYREDDARVWIPQTMAARSDGTAYTFAIVLGRDELIGICALEGLPDKPRIGFWLGKSYWGQGYMTEAVGALLDFADTQLNLDKVCSSYMEGNAASRRIHEKFGFQETGRSQGDVAATSETVTLIDVVRQRP